MHILLEKIIIIIIQFYYCNDKYKLDNQCGCIDPLALNFSSVATYDDGSCCYIAGCTDITSINYNPILMMVAGPSTWLYESNCIKL